MAKAERVTRAERVGRPARAERVGRAEKAARAGRVGRVASPVIQRLPVNQPTGRFQSVVIYLKSNRVCT